MLGGVVLANRKTKHFPLGLYKIENVLSVLVAISFFWPGYEIAREAFSGKMSPPDIPMPVIGLHAATILAIFVFGQYAAAAGRKPNPPR